MLIDNQIYDKCVEIKACVAGLMFISRYDKTTADLFGYDVKWWVWLSSKGLNLDLLKEIKTFNLDKLDGYDIGCLLKDHPKLIKYFIQYLDKLDGYDIGCLLQYQPHLENYFKKENK